MEQSPDSTFPFWGGVVVSKKRKLPAMISVELIQPSLDLPFPYHRGVPHPGLLLHVHVRINLGPETLQGVAGDRLLPQCGPHVLADVPYAEREVVARVDLPQDDGAGAPVLALQQVVNGESRRIVRTSAFGIL